MPAPEGLAGVDRQLRAVRQRANRFVLLDAACATATVLSLLAAALTAAALWGSSAMFRLATALALVGTAAAVAAALVYARRHRVDVIAAARIADRRARLSDRLTTLAALPRDRESSPLLPLLVAQTADLGALWRPARAFPRRLPRGALGLLVALGVLAGVALWPRAQPLARLLQNQPAAAPNPPPRNVPPRDSRQISRGPEQGDRLRNDGSRHTDTLNRGGERAGGDGADPGESAAATQSAASPAPDLPDQLRQAILAAVQGESVGRPQSLARAVTNADHGGAGTEPGTGQPQPGNRDGNGTSSSPLDARARHGVKAGNESPGDGESPDREPQTAGTPGPDSGTRPAGRTETGDDDGKRAGDVKPATGAAPPAGGGSQAGSLLARRPEGGTPGAGNAAPFKVTIGSFLKSIERNPGISRAAGGQARAGAAARPTPSLSDTQLADDLLRKAEVPPEYEDLVRRVYSIREEP